MNLSLIITMIVLFFIPVSIFGIVLYLVEPYLPFFLDGTFARPLITILFWPAYLAALCIYFLQRNNLEIFIPRVLIFTLALLAVVHVVHMMYLGSGNTWTIILRIDKTMDAVSQLITFLLAGIALLNLIIFYFLGSFVLSRFFVE